MTRAEWTRYLDRQARKAAAQTQGTTGQGESSGRNPGRQAMTQRTPATMPEMVSAVKAHALRNYERGGWDFVIECWEDEDVIRAIGLGVTSTSGAIRRVQAVVGTMNSRRRDVEAEAF